MTTYAVKDPEKRFFLHGGGAISSLEELFQELQLMEDWQFYHHVNDEKHDFAKWVEDVFGDRFLSKQMMKARSPEELKKAVFISLFR